MLCHVPLHEIPTSVMLFFVVFGILPKNRLAAHPSSPGDASSLPSFLGSTMNRLTAKVNLPGDAW